MIKILLIVSVLTILGTNANACHGGAFGSGDYRDNNQTKIWRY